MRGTAILLLGVLCCLPCAIDSRSLLDSSPVADSPMAYPDIKCVYDLFGQRMTVDTAPQELETYIVTAVDGEGLDALVRILPTQLSSKNYQLQRAMSVLPCLTAKFTRIGLQQLCQNGSLRPHLAAIEADQAVSAY